MNNKKDNQCKTKGCNLPVLDGKYCEQCLKVKKEMHEKLLAGTFGTAILGLFVATKKGAMKQVPKIAEGVLRVVLRK